MDLKKRLEERFATKQLISTFDKEKNSVRYENVETGIGVDIDLAAFQTRFEKNSEETVNEISHYIEKSLLASVQPESLESNKNRIYPVLRSTSFPKQNKNGTPFLTKEHTAETVIYYVLDSKDGYRFIEKPQLDETNWKIEDLYEIAKFNLNQKTFTPKKQTVAGNDFYFVNLNDGYDAARILLTHFLNEIKQSFHGKMVVSIPHQDVLILSDIQNEQGYKILAEMNMKFFTNGNTPITPLSFLYEDGELEPIFIMK